MWAVACHGPGAGECGCGGDAGSEAPAGKILPHHADEGEFATVDDFGATAIDEEAIGAIDCDSGSKTLGPPGETLERFGIALGAVRLNVYRGVMGNQWTGVGDIHAGADAGVTGADAAGSDDVA